MAFERLETGSGQKKSFGPYPERPYVVEVRGHETEFDAALSDLDGRLVHETAIDYVRMPPHYLVIEPKLALQGFSVEVTPRRSTRNSKVMVHVLELPDGHEGRALLTAFSAYSEGIRKAPEESRSEFERKKLKLQKAAQQLRDSGMWEPALWAEAMAAYFLYWPLMDYGEVQAQAAMARASAEKRGFRRIELMLLNLEGEALTEICSGNPYASLAEARAEAMERYGEAINLARELGEAHELAWSLNNLAIAEYYLDRHDEAGRLYAEALEVATDLEDAWFAARIRSSIKMLRESTSDKTELAGAVDFWSDEVEKQRLAGSAADLKHALVELGRVYKNLHLYPQAVATLSEAVGRADHPRDLHTLSRSALWLSDSYRALGDTERARQQVERAVPLLEEANNCRLLGSAYRKQANLARRQGRLEDAAPIRQQQARYVITDFDRALVYLEDAEDAYARRKIHSGEVARRYEQAFDLLRDGHDRSRALLSRLRMCIDERVAQRRPEDCGQSALQHEVQAVAGRATPAFELQLSQAWVDWLLSRAQVDQARAGLHGLIEKMAAFRHSLPGVLGAWYWDSRQEVFDQYIELTIEQERDQAEAGASLLALDWLRNVASQSVGSGELPAGADSELRTLAVSLETEADPEALDELRRRIDLKLASSPLAKPAGGIRSGLWLNRTIAGLPGNVAVLAFHFSDRGSWSWRVDAEGVELRHIDDTARPAAKLEILRSRLRVRGDRTLNTDLESLTGYLLGDTENLPDYLFVLAGGASNGFPFDMLRTNNAYLAEQSVVVNMQSLSALPHIAGLLERRDEIDSVFVAGAARWAGLSLVDLPAVASELETVTTSFPKARVFSAAGRDFRPETVRTPAFRNADLIHIASHARADLAYPELSRLYFGDAKSPEDFLTPRALSGIPLVARMAVLSACETSGSNAFSFDSNLGFVTTLLANGADLVLATLWPVADEHTLELMGEGYRRHAAGEAFIEAFGRAKRDLLASGRRSATAEVLAYQLYVQ